MEQNNRNDVTNNNKAQYTGDTQIVPQQDVKTYRSPDELPEEEKEEYMLRKKSIDKGMTVLCLLLIFLSMGISFLMAMGGNGIYGNYTMLRLATLPVVLLIWCMIRSSKMSALRREFNIKR